MTWSARQYATFEDERTRPVRDLLSALPAIDARRVVDVGCGPGNSTEVLAARFPAAHVSAFDSSPDMIDAARRRMPDVEFRVDDLTTWNPAESFDVILSNAVLQWVPDHAQLFPRLMHRLTAGGALAVQMPDNLESPAHRLMRSVAAEGPWAQRLGAAAAARTPLPSTSWYYQLLQPLSARLDLWSTTYVHILHGGVDAIADWFKGSGLRPFLQPLSDTERGEYLRMYAAGLAELYPCNADGSVLLPFPRFFLTAIRRGNDG
jgi:trans-aconitate 2-methyltransferase